PRCAWCRDRCRGARGSGRSSWDRRYPRRTGGGRIHGGDRRPMTTPIGSSTMDALRTGACPGGVMWRTMMVVGLAAAAACSEPADEEDPTGPAAVTSSDAPTSTSAAEGSTAAAEDTDPGGKLDVQPAGDLPDITEGGTGCGQDVDIVFVMDVSTTMGPFLDQLATEIIAVDEALDAIDLPGHPHHGLAAFVCDV